MRLRSFATVIAAAALVFACSDDGTGPENGGTASTQLFLAPDGVLSTQQMTSGVAKIFMYGSGSSEEWTATLHSDTYSGNCDFVLWLGAGEMPGQTGKFDVSLLAGQGASQTELAKTTFTVPFNENFVRYNATVTGQSGGHSGDVLTLRITLRDASKGGIMFGAGDADSHVVVPAEAS